MGIFHQYDIRGLYGKEINEDFAYNLGKALLQYTKAKKIVIGYDSRIGNLSLFSSIARALIEQGIEVVHAGLITKPMLYFVTWKHRYDLGIYISASHNPKEYNGFKVTWKDRWLSYESGFKDIESILNSRVKFKISKKKGKIVSIDFIDEYVKFLSSHLSKDFRKYIKNRTVRILADASNGSAGEIIKRFLLENDVTYELLFTHPDGTFPGHNPNPLDSGATVVLSRKMLEFRADLGFVLDPDADRIRFVDDKGNVVDNNYIDCLIVENLLIKHKKAAIVHDLIARKILSETIKKNNGKDFISKVGVPYVAKCMIENNSIFGSEVSGHRLFDSVNNTDSGLMTLVFLLNTLYSKERAGKKLSTLWKKYDKYPDLGEINYKLPEGKDKQGIMDAVQKYYENNKKKLNVKDIFNLDGVSIVTDKYWFNIRPSNTEPLLRLRAEGKDKRTLEQLKVELEKFIL
jgi:phosphomannomutase